MLITDRSAVTAILALACLCCVWPAAGQEAVEATPLVSLIERAHKLKTLEGDPWETQWIRSDVLLSATTLAWWSENDEALIKAEAAAKQVFQSARKTGDDYLLDQPMQIHSEVLAAQGKWEQAEKAAWGVPDQSIRAEARARLAVLRARAGDHAAYRRQITKSLELIDQLLKIDIHRPSDEREWPGYSATYILQSIVDDLVLAKTWENGKALEELKWLAQSFEALPLSEGAQAELRSIFGYAYAGLREEQAAREWINHSLPLLRKQRQIVEALGEDDAWMAYGVEVCEYRLVLAYAELGDYDAAEQMFKQIKVPHTIRLTRAYLAVYLADAGRQAQAADMLQKAVDEAIRLYRDAKQQAEVADPDADEDDWLVDTSYDAFWDVHAAAEAAANMNAPAQIERLRSDMPEELFQYAIDLGVTWAKHRPILQK